MKKLYPVGYFYIEAYFRENNCNKEELTDYSRILLTNIQFKNELGD